MGLHATWQHGYTVLTDGPAEGVTSSGLTLDDPKEPFAWAPGASSGSSPLKFCLEQLGRFFEFLGRIPI